MKKNELALELEKNPEYQNLLFKRGYILTNAKGLNTSGFPFYDNWAISSVHHIGNNSIYVYTNQYQKSYSKTIDDVTITLIGHAYNPFTLQSDEVEIIVDLSKLYEKNNDAFFHKLSELTGVFVIIISTSIKGLIVQDACGIMTLSYGTFGSQMYISSHSQLIADLNCLPVSKKSERYLNASFYKIGIAHMCGLDTPYETIKLLTPNTYLDLESFEVSRFYPTNKNGLSIDENYEKISDIMQKSIRLCTDKWDCALSLTGGVDSKLTLAASDGYYDKLKYFSFISSKAEEKDALAANEICKALGLEHMIYTIPDNNEDIIGYKIIKMIMDHNQAYIRTKDNNDARKRAFFSNGIANMPFKVEVKSHVSEVGRAFYYKKTGKKKFKFPLTSRNMSNLAKRNLFNRIILKQMDQSFLEFIKISKFGNFANGFDETDMFYWENRMCVWGGLVKQSFDISHETTIIYNNRLLLEFFLKFPLKDRVSDSLQLGLLKKMNKQIYDLGISVNNAMKNKFRIKLECLFYELNSIKINFAKNNKKNIL